MKILIPWIAVICAAAPAWAESPSSAGEVRVPLESYQALSNAADAQKNLRASPPSRYGFGSGKLDFSIRENGEQLTAEIDFSVTVKVYGEQWAVIPILPPGTAVTEITAGGSVAQLVTTASGLALSTKKSGEHKIRVRYEVDAQRRGGGTVIPVPLPAAVSTKMEGTLPGAGLDVAVIPSAGVSAVPSGSNTRVRATIPSARGVQISWRTPVKEGYAVSRAQYSGVLLGDAISWTAELDAQVFGGHAQVALLPEGVALSKLTVDGKSGTVLLRDGRFTTLLKAKGAHRIGLSFETPVKRDSGPPRVDLDLLPVPISRFELKLPGRKDVSVTPEANVRTQFSGKTTVSSIHAPMSSEIGFSWSEAIPENLKEDVRANAEVYHALHAEEGVLHGRAIIVYEVTRGETNQITFEAPQDVQINRISSDGGGVSDWRATKSGKKNLVSVFLDREIREKFVFDVYFERLMGKQGEKKSVGVPLLQMTKVHRQRGMAALLSSAEFSLKPVVEAAVSKVGENQLPVFIRKALSMTVAHTYKYMDQAARLSVEAVPPEKKSAKFDTQVDTLISLSDVTMKGSATIRVNLKSGKMDELRISLPEDITLLNVTAPSKRTHNVKNEGGQQWIEIHFTQDMEGEFAIDLDYERIMGKKSDASARVPNARVEGAEPEQGRIAVEALTAVEVKASTADNLSSLDVNELPQQLLLKTRNPIRLAYKYVQADPVPQLVLQVTRHKELQTQVATIEDAHYRTLFTRDGLAVTTATFMVRNSRKQFLKICLPEGSEVWSVFVDGKPEKPALAAQSEGRPKDCEGLNVLIKIISSAGGFPAEIVYRTKIAHIENLGQVGSDLPTPDMVVTNTRWDVYLPDKLSYQRPETNMDVVDEGTVVPREEMAKQLGQNQADSGQALRVAVPMSGMQYRFEKLYANQADEAAHFRIVYASVGGQSLANLVGVLGTALFWAGLFFWWRPHPKVSRRFCVSAVLGGLMCILVASFLLGMSSGLIQTVSFVAVLLGLGSVVAEKTGALSRFGPK